MLDKIISSPSYAWEKTNDFVKEHFVITLCSSIAISIISIYCSKFFFPIGTILASTLLLFSLILSTSLGYQIIENGKKVCISVKNKLVQSLEKIKECFLRKITGLVVRN